MRILGETICRHDVTTDEARIRFGHCVTPCCACRKRFDVMLGARSQCSRARGMYGGHGTVGAKDESIKSSFNATHTHTQRNDLHMQMSRRANGARGLSHQSNKHQQQQRNNANLSRSRFCNYRLQRSGCGRLYPGYFPRARSLGFEKSH